MTDFKDYVIERLMNDNAAGDVVIDQDGDRFLYVDVETQTIYVVTVQVGVITAAS